jgi:ABC-type uncharacterized transport system permease subunit
MGLHLDAVFWGAILSVLIAVVIFVYLTYKVLKLMKKDAARHQSDQQS